MSQQPMNVNSANQFIGSRISLISKADIRYGGILYSLDLQEATISLAKVRSYGTEDRPTERPIPVKDEIYEFIIFRGADIKSIDVVEPPKSGSTLSCGLPQDPAIIEVSHFQGGSSMGARGQHHHCGIDGSHSQGGGGGGMRYTSNRGGSEGLFEGLLRGGRSNGGGGGRGHQGGRRTSNDAGTQSDRRNNGGRNARNVDNGGGRRSRQDNNYARGSSGGNGSRAGRGNTPNRSNRGGGGGRDDRDPRAGGRGQSRNRSQNRQRGIIQAQMPPKVTFEDPFDFEKSNEELKTAMEKLKITDEEKAKEGGGGDDEALEKEKEEPMIYYDKDKFFDNISCEALERTKGKPNRTDWRAERKLNAETFGLNWNANQMRNGPRSFRPRNNDRDGGYRGGNNQIRYNNYNNRYNNRNSYGNSQQQQQRND